MLPKAGIPAIIAGIPSLGVELRAICVILISACSLVVVPDAFGHEAPPRAKLEVNGDRDKLGTWSWSWLYNGGGGHCAGTTADGIPSYEPRASVDTLHSRPRIYFLRDQHVRVTGFRAYSQLDDRSGYPTGPSERVDSRVRRVRSGGEVVGWELRFRTAVVDVRYFDLRLAFAGDGSRCRNKGSASYAFGLERE